MGSKNHQKSNILHSGHPEDPFWLFWVTPMPKYGQKLTFSGGYIILYRSKLRPLISTLRACIAPYVELENTLRPHSTTQRPLNSTLRACTAPHVALETEHTIRPSRTTQRPINSALKACKAGEHHGTPYYTTIERLLNSTLRASKSPNVVHWRHL